MDFHNKNEDNGITQILLTQPTYTHQHSYLLYGLFVEDMIITR